MIKSVCLEWHRRIEVLRKESSRLLLSGLILLLGIRLTGLSCLDDWQDLLLVTGHQIHSQVSTGTPGDVGLGVDGCPCHLFFKYVDLSSLHVASPPLATLTSMPTGYAPILARFLFHPPILG